MGPILKTDFSQLGLHAHPACSTDNEWVPMDERGGEEERVGRREMASCLSSLLLLFLKCDGGSGNFIIYSFNF